MSAVPIVVTEVEVVIATATATAADSEVIPVSTETSPVKTETHDTNLPENPRKTIPSPPKEVPKEKEKEKEKQKKPKPKPKQKQKDQKPKEQKYFHEPGWDLESGHYDSRFFQGKVPYEQHRPILRHLIRSYLTTFRELGVDTWLAHGSLLGWWWNGRIMPWDYDLDVQVSVATLAFLGERYNRSIHFYEYDTDEDEDLGSFTLDTQAAGFPSTHISTTDGNVTNAESDDEAGGVNNTATTTKAIKKMYLLDINPHYGALTKGNGANVIDARWIDTSNGMFIDITGLRERDVDKNPGVWSCKNNHRYRTGELWPLRRTEFEGVQAWIPYAFDKVLTDEYGPKSLVAEEWAG
ncbi:hypothetical protein RRF57_005113 [Xylaria bambusicola]|uniref:LicD/FKTN/FKRP nucleotidyltransferase domain-containing protein n=1 Tax=Xylaria bambusicola TaxID=326684 RepID=A0AAN7UHE6_9PEZI